MTDTIDPELAEVAEPLRDPRVIALERLIAAEGHQKYAQDSLLRAQRQAEKADEELDEAREAFGEAMDGTVLR